jgi:type IV secretion system protein VirB4
MMGVLKKRQDSSALKTPVSKSASVDARDFIPHFTHYNAHTLVTKNGEVTQTLRVDANKSGMDYEPHDRSGGNLRECIRKALSQHIASDNVAIWIHTLRKRRAVTFRAHYDNNFADYVNKGWRTKNGWSHQYYNEVYITLVYDGQNGGMLDKDLYKDGAITKRNRMMRDTYIEVATNEMDLMMDTIADELGAGYRVHRLSLAERIPVAIDGLPQAPIFYSEPMEFLSYLLNLRSEEVPLPDADISAALQSCDLLFGFNAMETKSPEGVKRFAALLSLKQYREVPSHTVDMLLQAPMELIISQAFHYIPGEAALKEYHEQKDYFDMSGDTYSMQSSGLSEMLGSNRGRPTDFGSQQISIVVMVDELKRLDDDIGYLQKAFSSIGLVFIREDIRLEEIFWSILPGNFNFIRRKTAMPTMRIGGFAKLNRFASGRSEDTFWREPVALLPTLVNSPYFFNFHVQDNGHTLWVDFNSFNDSMMNKSLSLLLTHAHKLNPRVFYFDHHQSAFLWFNKLGADYKILHAREGSRTFAINPFSLENSPRNIGFLAAWCSELISATPEERDGLKSAIENYYASSEPLHLPGFVASLKLTSPALAGRFAPWLAGGEFDGLFSAPIDDFDHGQEWLGIDLTEALGSAQNAVATFAYLLHRIILSLNGNPTIIVLQHALPILQHPFFAQRLSSMLEMLKENNAMMIFCVRYSDSLQGNPVIDTLLQSCASHVVSPDDLNLEYAQIFPSLLDANDQDLLWKMSRMQGDMMLKQGDDTVALRTNLDSMPDVAAIFDNDIKTLMSAGGPHSALPKKAAS